MSRQLEVASKLEIRSVVRFLWAKNCSSSEIHRQLSEVYGNKAFSRQAIAKWCELFESGRNSVEDEIRQGRPVSSVTDDNIQRVEQMILDNRRVTEDEIAIAMNISHGSVHTIISEHLKFRKVCARWVPRLLTAQHKEKRFQSALQFLFRYENEGNDFLDKIVTGDESWVHYFTPETKRSSKEWRHVGSPPPKKCKQVPSAGKVMLTLFFDNQGVVYSEYMPRGTTINSEAYCETLKRLRKAIKERRPGKLSKGIVLLHDNATPHSARVTLDLLEKKFKWEQWEHPPYSPDLSPCDFHVFGPMKEALAKERFGNDEEVKNGVRKWLTEVGRDFFNSGIEKLVSRYDKCLNRYGDYVEK